MRIKHFYTFLIFFFFTQFLFTQQLIEIDEIKFIHLDKKSFEDSGLNDAIALSKSPLFSRELLEADMQKLKKFYFDNGFFDAEVDTAVKVNLEDEEAVITFKITENKRYTIDTVKVNGIEKTPQETLSKLKKIKTVKHGIYYSKGIVLQYINELIDTLQNNGHMNARLKLDSGTIIKRFRQNAAVIIEINLEGSDTVYYFGSTEINIKNNVYGVNEKYPEEEIVYKKGEIFSKAKKLDTERNMSKIPIISNAKLNPESYSGTAINFSADINLNKRNELTPYIKGSNFENRFYAGAGIRYLNRYFLGGNRTLVLELEEDFHSIPVNRTVFSAAITQPNFIQRNITLINRISVGFNNVDNYKNYFASNLTTLNYYIAPHTFYNNAFIDLTEELIWIKYDSLKTGTQTQFNSFLSITFEHDNTNYLLDPTGGFYHSVLAGHSGLIPKLAGKLTGKEIFYSQFYKVFTVNKFYFSLQKKGRMVLAAKLNSGELFEYGNGGNVIPVQPFYKFFSGGSSSLRGWNAKSNGYVANPVNGGKFLVEGSIELRKKLFPKSDNWTKNLGAAVFLDYGNIWDSHKDFRFSTIAAAIGFGIRYDLFIGPIRVDFGFKLYEPSAPENKQWLFDETGRIFKDKFTVQFGIGQAF